MKKLVLVAALLLGFSVVALAQDVPAVEVFGGYSYFRLNGTDPDGDFGLNMNGWNASIAFNANKWAGFVADFGGVYATDEEEDEGEIYGTKVKIHSFMFGPRISMRRGKVTPFAQFLIGMAHVNVNDKRYRRTVQQGK